MKKIILFAFCVFATLFSFCQQILNVIYMGEKGVTADIKEATAFIVVKKASDGHFEKYNYKTSGPLVSMRTYSDTSLTILDGLAINYNSSGQMTSKGQYVKGKKENSWSYFNDTFKIFKEEVYNAGVLIKTIDPDTVKNDSLKKFGDEKEAEFNGGKAAWKKFLIKNLDTEVALKTRNGGKVIVGFTIGTDGKSADIYLAKSAHFFLDQESLRIIYMAPHWQPAFQNGKKVKAYRRQPFSYVVQ